MALCGVRAPAETVSRIARTLTLSARIITIGSGSVSDVPDILMENFVRRDSEVRMWLWRIYQKRFGCLRFRMKNSPPLIQSGPWTGFGMIGKFPFSLA